MKLGKLIIAVILLTSANTYAQDDAKRECDRMLYLAQQARIERNDYKESTLYMIKAETLCGGLDEKNMKILIASIRNTINGVQDPAEKMAYCDSLEGAYSRAEAAGMYNQAEDLIRAANILGTTNPDRIKADQLFVRGIAAQGEKTNEGYISYYYYNLYAIYLAAPEAEKPALKKRMITVYFELSGLIGKANMSAQTQETINQYFNAVVKTREDILPELNDFMSNFPQDPVAKKLMVNNFLILLESKNITDAPEYIQLIDTLVKLDPNSVATKIKKGDALIATGKISEAIAAYKEARGQTEDDAEKNELSYKIAHGQFKIGSYSAAYSTAMSVSGKFRGDALVIAGNSVGKNANNCGASTLERKSNYVYAVQLLQQAHGLGASTGGSIGAFKANYPSTNDIFDNGSPTSVPLTCYGVSVNPKG